MRERSKVNTIENNFQIPPNPPLLKGRCEEIGIAGRAGISSKFYKCGRFKGKGDKALQVTTIIEVFHRG